MLPSQIAFNRHSFTNFFADIFSFILMMSVCKKFFLRTHNLYEM